MKPLIDFSSPYPILVALLLFILVLVLARETRRSYIPGMMLGVFLVIIVGHAIELAMANYNMPDVVDAITNCVTVDFIFIAISFFAYLWIDDIETKEGQKVSIDESLNWFWKKV